MMIIALDIGNSSSKILWPDQRLEWITDFDYSLEEQINLAELKLASAGIFSVSSVIEPTRTLQIIRKLQSKLQLMHWQVKIWSSQEILQLVLPQQAQALAHLGTDRALRLYRLLISSPGEAGISFGCGTAFCLEVVRDQKLVDSRIVPGLALQLDALTSATAKLPPLTENEVASHLASTNPVTTAWAISAGIIGSYAALISELAQRYHITSIWGSGRYAGVVAAQCTNLKLKLMVNANDETLVLRELAAREVRI